MPPIPIVVCGRSPEIANKVKQDLQPEYDGTLRATRLLTFHIADSSIVVKIVLSPDAGIKEIPKLLSGQNPPVAVALGGAFDDATVESLRDAASKAGDVVWIRVDKSRFGEMPPMDDKEGFGAALAKRIKTSLQEHKVGQDGGDESGVYLC
ncbi:hypothetical protein BU25DRAFT_408233 [Macroventuria anomochaeta]|uniref:Uncharacterized protein n=1 Tax=Macroventuria anomochaeta TaxID=301207 RepID=A0ACB6S7K3_9PLEO|nr:uncharacterized protein BU25DRAFT_408233 [Macroventuria anomochaeta]KAF2630261.1 hypothetical protein BU25DRAFT_408233 [Macroventuria anomochaeta]